VPSTEELALMIAGIRDHQHKALHVLLAKTGMRRGEVHLLDIDSIDLVEGSVAVSRTGKRTPTKLPIDKECCDVLHNYLARLHQFPRVEGESSLFTNRNGTRASENTLYECRSLGHAQEIHASSLQTLANNNAQSKWLS